MKRILVIGGEGYIGSVLCPELLRANYEVRSFDVLAFDNGASVLQNIGWGKNYTFIKGDMRVKDQLASSLDDVDAVVLLAGLVGDPITKKYPDESSSINEKGVQAAIKLILEKGIRKIIFVSTCSNYGLIPSDAIANESWPLNPLSTYAKAKIAAEELLMNLGESCDSEITILRFATAFGLSPRMRFDLTVSEFVRDLYHGRPLTVYDADTWRPYCHVIDFARLIMLVLESSSKRSSCEIFNAGGTVNNFTKRMLVELISERVSGANIHFQEHGQDPRNYRVDFRRVEERFGFVPSRTVEDGIHELIWALQNDLFGLDVDDAQRDRYGNYKLSDELILTKDPKSHRRI